MESGPQFEKTLTPWEEVGDGYQKFTDALTDLENDLRFTLRFTYDDPDPEEQIATQIVSSDGIETDRHIYHYKQLKRAVDSERVALEIAITQKDKLKISSHTSALQRVFRRFISELKRYEYIDSTRDTSGNRRSSGQDKEIYTAVEKCTNCLTQIKQGLERIKDEPELPGIE